MATSYDREIRWVVASLHRSPFLPRSLDVVLSMFAPIDAADVRRVVRDDGALVTVTPGPDHLDALRAILYSDVQPHSPTPALMAGDTLFEAVRLHAHPLSHRRGLAGADHESAGHDAVLLEHQPRHAGSRRSAVAS